VRGDHFGHARRRQARRTLDTRRGELRLAAET
jgi:hypothetical protein